VVSEEGAGQGEDADASDAEAFATLDFAINFMKPPFNWCAVPMKATASNREFLR
jgi:hypothetical protein